MTEHDISPFQALDFIRDNAKKLGALKGRIKEYERKKLDETEDAPI